MEPLRKISEEKYFIVNEDSEAITKKEKAKRSRLNLSCLKDYGSRIFNKNFYTSKKRNVKIENKLEGIEYISTISNDSLKIICRNLSILDLADLTLSSKKIGAVAYSIWMIKTHELLENLVNDLLQRLAASDKRKKLSTIREHDQNILITAIFQAEQLPVGLRKINLLRNAIIDKSWGDLSSQFRCFKNVSEWSKHGYWYDSQLIMKLLSNQWNIKNNPSFTISSDTLMERTEFLIPYLDLFSENVFTPTIFACEMEIPLDSRTADAIIRVIRYNHSIESIFLSFAAFSLEQWKLISNAINENSKIREGQIGIYLKTLETCYWNKLEKQFELRKLSDDICAIVLKTFQAKFDVICYSNSLFTFERINK
ncbi:MAG: hypothetical protein H0W50_11055 [Parachlamydiaceae bacterium]|nr:hypothetical protein [Parachlamydiaceae bacterium]